MVQAHLTMVRLTRAQQEAAAAGKSGVEIQGIIQKAMVEAFNEQRLDAFAMAAQAITVRSAWHKAKAARDKGDLAKRHRLFASECATVAAQLVALAQQDAKGIPLGAGTVINNSDGSKTLVPVSTMPQIKEIAT